MNAQDQNKGTALHEAARKGFLMCAHALLQHGANPNLINNRGETALFSALVPSVRKEHNPNVVKLLIGAKADVRIKSDFGLHCGQNILQKSIAYHYPLEVIALILGSGADFEERNNKGENSLELAEKLEKENVVKLLKKWPSILARQQP